MSGFASAARRGRSQYRRRVAMNGVNGLNNEIKCQMNWIATHENSRVVKIGNITDTDICL